MKKILLSVCFLSMIMACADYAWQAEYDEVMVVHDEVMPEVNTIQKTNKALKKHLMSLPETDSSRDEILDLMKDLSKAEEDMFDWMNGFSKPSRDTAHEEAVAYLAKEKDKISKVSADMKSSIKAGQDYIKKISQAQ